jgi:hypothetical protein
MLANGPRRDKRLPIAIAASFRSFCARWFRAAFENRDGKIRNRIEHQSIRHRKPRVAVLARGIKSTIGPRFSGTLLPAPEVRL